MSRPVRCTAISQYVQSLAACLAAAEARGVQEASPRWLLLAPRAVKGEGLALVQVPR